MGIAKLALEDGTIYRGRSFGAAGTIDGEVVFNTSMTGYQEILTDPSYHGQVVAMTYPQIGNIGVNPEDEESARPWVRALVVRELSRLASNHRSRDGLSEYLQRHGVLGIEGIDTRALVRRIRQVGAMIGVVSTTETDDARLIDQARAAPGLIGRDLTREVMPASASRWIEPNAADDGSLPHVVALDFGMKRHIPRMLAHSGCRVTVAPGSMPAEAILEQHPDGIFVSNGPGDPAALGEAVRTLRGLIEHAAEGRNIPIFGICLGFQLLGQAFGGATFKLKFGHRGANHPVRDERTGRIEITTQNHGFAVDPGSLPDDVEASHVNLYDGTLEGLRHRRLPVFAVQYHPEASAGPHDSGHLFGEFRSLMTARPVL